MGDFTETGLDYVSLDTEGSELEILRTIDFARHRIALFTIEHNFVEPRREEIQALLVEAGYDRLNIGFDDWYLACDFPDQAESRCRRRPRRDQPPFQERFQRLKLAVGRGRPKQMHTPTKAHHERLSGC